MRKTLGYEEYFIDRYGVSSAEYSRIVGLNEDLLDEEYNSYFFASHRNEICYAKKLRQELRQMKIRNGRYNGGKA